MQKIHIITAEKYAELVSTVEVVLERKFEGASLTTLCHAVEARIDELEMPNRQEAVFNNDALEIGVLAELLKTLTSLTEFQGSPAGVR